MTVVYELDITEYKSTQLDMGLLLPVRVLEVPKHTG
jgi:hypothetical protein